MKKLLPLFMFALLAFAGCQPEKAVYQESSNPKTVIRNCDKFVNCAIRNSKNYDAKDWSATIDEFFRMCKNYKSVEDQLPDKDKERFRIDLNKFMKVVDATGNADMAFDIKKRFAKVMEI